MENTEINGAMYIDSSELDKLFTSSSSGRTAHSPGVSLWSSGTVGSGLVSVSPMTGPSGSLYFIDPNQNEWDPFKEILVTYSEDEVLNKILNEMADEVEGKVKPKVTFPTETLAVDPYDYRTRIYTSAGSSPFTTTTFGSSINY